ncbi:hypothetical protein LMG24238_06219 [Paraburkholderia sediminicola]|uniref:Gp16 family phage-associated protein n=1 Tax=Paraburkholderia sediminicola TaxID=458836 RepID=A0A6J5CGC8_9BURK|nr:DNA-binding protein [Paraburkholderia sediminicola]CAB3736331.1 hypothetical protein LMG24238_06219 [Paraburkholderia sediminicola]
MSRHTLSLEEARANFEAQGVAVTDWAEAHGFKREDVYAVLNGRTKGRRGQAHCIAVALGLKSTEVVLVSKVPPVDTYTETPSSDKEICMSKT